MLNIEETKLLRQQGHRLTPQRLLVLEVIKSRSCHITAEAIHAAIVPQQPYIDIATVYRALQWLETVGLVARINIDGTLHYEYHPLGNHHHHLICQQCGHVIEIPDDVFATLKMNIQQRYNFNLHLDHLALPGRCAACAGAEPAN
jgi:Fur family ferric uptake transcriptional regulator